MKKIISSIALAIALSGTVAAQTTTAKASTEGKASTMTPSQVIDKYFAALGGKAKMEAVKSLTLENTINAQGMEINSVTKKMGNKFRSTQSVMGQEMVQVFDGEKGYMNQMGTKTDFGAEQVAEMKKGLVMDALAYDATKFSSVTTEKIDGKDYNVLTSDKGKFYFDAGTGLLYKVTTPQGEAITKSYLTVDGLKFPEVMEATGMGQNVTIKTTKVTLNSGVTADDFK